MAYLFANPLELLIHMLGSSKCVVAGISGSSHILAIERNFTVTVSRTGTFLVSIYLHNIKQCQTPDIRNPVVYEVLTIRLGVVVAW